MGDEAPNTDSDVLCRFCEAKARSQNAPKRKRTVPKSNESVLLAFRIVNQSLECCARCEGSLRRAIKSAPADTRDDGVGEEGEREGPQHLWMPKRLQTAHSHQQTVAKVRYPNRYPNAKRTS